ncbi:MAG: hypothetical protein FWE20_11440 [Defluviitaleaceae bacterium]|nr:hypothetical protein [Defluviitaleaceae bacterium]
MTPGVPAKPDFGFVGWTERTRSGTQGADDDPGAPIKPGFGFVGWSSDVKTAFQCTEYRFLNRLL